MIISCIVAMTRDGLIGTENRIPWHLPADLQHFKRTTLHHPVLMGRKCYESIGKPLKDRINILVTRNIQYGISGCVTVHSIEEGLAFAAERETDEIFIIGGGEIYRQSMDYWTKLYVTWVDAQVSGDTFFPSLDWNRWSVISEEKHQPDDKNPYQYTYNTYLLKT